MISWANLWQYRPRKAQCTKEDPSSEWLVKPFPQPGANAEEALTSQISISRTSSNLVRDAKIRLAQHSYRYSIGLRCPRSQRTMERGTSWMRSSELTQRSLVRTITRFLMLVALRVRRTYERCASPLLRTKRGVLLLNKHRKKLGYLVPMPTALTERVRPLETTCSK